MSKRMLAMLCLAIILIGVPVLWRKMTWEPPPFKALKDFTVFAPDHALYCKQHAKMVRP